MSIDAVVFDIGNVLIEWQPEVWYDRHYGKKRREKLFAEVDLHQMNERVDRGENYYTVLAETEAAYPAFAEEIRAWRDNWLQLAAPVLPHSVKLMRALQAKGVPVFSLTNFGVETYEMAASIYSFLNEFDRDYVSGRMQVTKPDPKIYEMLEDDCGVARDRLLFTDDRIDNISTARARGWQTHHFKGSQGWADALVRHGLLTVEEAAR